MNALKNAPFLPAITLAFACALCMQPVRADVYAYTEHNGTVHLSNAQEDSGYSAMVSEPPEQLALQPATYIGKPIHSIPNKVFYDDMVDQVAQTYGLESALLHAVISVESRYRPNAVSKRGAVGLMQLMPSISRRFGVADARDPMQNLHGGAKYLRYLLNKYSNDRGLTLAAYNAGEGAVAKYGNQIPPYRETKSYVPQVMGYYRKYLVNG
jgi:soluble lytic murein transglycosylase-like protein